MVQKVREFLTNKYMTVYELIDVLSKVTNMKKIKWILPDYIAYLVAPFIEMVSNLFKQKSLFTPYSIYVLKTNANFSHAKATKELSYNPRNIEVTLKDTYEWLKDYKKEKKNEKKARNI